MLYYVHGLLVGSCGTIQLQDVQTAYLAAATTTSSTPDYSTEMNGARGVRATSSHHWYWFAAVVCKMEITSREYYSFCVISSMI